MMALASIAAVLAGLGVFQALAGAWLSFRFSRAVESKPADRFAVTLLKPLHGDEPLLEQALASLCVQDISTYQIVFGVQSASDPAIKVVKRLSERFPAVDITLVIDPARHGINQKVGNLINMLPAAKHDLLAIADSDLHVAPDYVRRLVAALEPPGTGLATVLYTGRPANRGIVGALGTLAITHYFLPGALLARGLGRQDCLGATMMLHRDTLRRIGGLEALVGHLADDNALGRLVQNLGLSVRLAGTVAATTVPETCVGDLFRHELRWARTVRALEPVAFLASSLQYPLIWAALALACSGGAIWAAAAFPMVWLLRWVAAECVDRVMVPSVAPSEAGLAFRVPFWLLPLRELMSTVVMIASYGSDQVDWRGHSLQADGPVLHRSARPGFLTNRPAISLSTPTLLQRD